MFPFTDQSERAPPPGPVICTVLGLYLLLPFLDGEDVSMADQTCVLVKLTVVGIPISSRLFGA